MTSHYWLILHILFSKSIWWQQCARHSLHKWEKKGLLLFRLHLSGLIFLVAVAVIWVILHVQRPKQGLSRCTLSTVGTASHAKLSCSYTTTLQFMALWTHTVKFNLILTLNYIFPSINSSFPSPNQHSLSLYFYIWLTAPKGITMAFTLFQPHSSHLPTALYFFFVCLKIKYASHYLCHQYISADFPGKLHDTGVRIIKLELEFCS